VRLLFDECLPRPLRVDFIQQGHDVRTVPEMGWASHANGDLLAAAAAAGFDALLTMDRNIPQQQNLARYLIPVLAFRATSNTVEALRPLVPTMLQALPTARAGEFVSVGLPTRGDS
jgi:hypothetical protein